MTAHQSLLFGFAVWKQLKAQKQYSLLLVILNRTQNILSV